MTTSKILSSVAMLPPMHPIGNLWTVLGKAFVPVIPSLIKFYETYKGVTGTEINHKP